MTLQFFYIRNITENSDFTEDYWLEYNEKFQVPKHARRR